MTTCIYVHPSCLGHDPKPVLGLAPARLRAVMDALHRPGFKALEWREAMPIDRNGLELVHTPDYVDSVLSPVPAGEQRAFDFETFATSGTAEAALHSAGGVLDAVKAVVAGEARNAFCLASPGGHHAEAEMAQGFCFFNHVAIAAVAALTLPGISQVAVLDFDAHHGNGTQSLFWSRKACCLVSLHEDLGLTGFPHERGAHDNILNIPLPSGSDGKVFRDAIKKPWPCRRSRLSAPICCWFRLGSTCTATIHWPICASESPIMRGWASVSRRLPAPFARAVWSQCWKAVITSTCWGNAPLPSSAG